MQDAATCSTPKPRAGIEGLDVYRVAVEFYRLLRQSTRGRRGHAIDQSYRAAESVVLDIAEAYPMSGADRARRFRIAGGEAAECHAGTIAVSAIAARHFGVILYTLGCERHPRAIY